MTKGSWINLPVKDVGKSKEFFGKLGFSFDEMKSTDEMAVLWVGESKSHVLLFPKRLSKVLRKMNWRIPEKPQKF